MPVNQSGDFLLNGKSFMLWRDPKGTPSWKRTRVPDSLTNQRRLWHSIYRQDVYGGLPDELDHPEIWDDWSGGFGHYRQTEVKGGQFSAVHYHQGFGVDTRFPGQIILAQLPQVPAASNINVGIDTILDVPVANAPVGAGQLFVVCNNGQFGTMQPNGATALSIAAYGSTNFRLGHRCAVFGSFVYLAAEGSGFIQASAYNTAWTQASSLGAQCFIVSAARMWRAFGTNMLQSIQAGQDPMSAANWSATIAIGNGNLPIQDLFAFEDHVFAGLPDGLYIGDETGTFNNVSTEIGAKVHPDNVRDISAHNGGVVFAAEDSVWWYKPSSGANSQLRQLWPIMDIRPFASVALNLWDGTSVSGLSLKGHVTALEGHGQFLYAGLFTGSLSVLCAGIDASGVGPYVWHPMQIFPGARINRIHVDQITAATAGAPIPQRLWVATEASFGAQTNCTSALYFWPIPLANGNPLSDPTFSPNYYPFGVVEQSMTDSAVPTVWKLWRKVETLMEGAGGSAAADCAASTWMSIDAVMDATMSAVFDSTTYVQKPKDYHYFTNQSNTAIGQQTLFQSVLRPGMAASWSSSPGTTPVVRTIVGHNVFRPRIAELVEARVRIADEIADRQGNSMRPGAVMLNDLDTMSRSSSPFPLTDLVGQTYPVIVQPGVDQQEVYQAGEDYPEIVATVKLGVVDASWNAAPTVPVHPDGG